VGLLAAMYRSGLMARLPLPLCAAAAILVSAAVTLPYLADRLMAPRLPAVAGTLVFPLARVATEFVLARLGPFGAMPVLGTTQHAVLPLIQVAALTGAYGVSFLVAWCAPVAHHLWRERRPAGRPVLVYGCAVTAVLIGGWVRLATAPPPSRHVRVAALVPPPAAAGARAHATAALRQRYGSQDRVQTQAPDALRVALAPVTGDLLADTRSQGAAGAEIVVWSETAAWVMQRDEQDLLDRIARVARTGNLYISAGLSVFSDPPVRLRNQTVLITPDGTVAWRYDKAYPTPMERLQPGNGRVPTLSTPYGRLAAAICFDADFPDLMRQPAADVMLLPAHDWPGIATAHAQRAVFRAIENGYAIVRPDADGVSSIVDNRGHTLASASGATITAAVSVRGERTPYRSVGDLFSWLDLLTLAALAIAAILARYHHGADGNELATPP
jgi:apolipoprotein N-acyltransferase